MPVAILCPKALIHTWVSVANQIGVKVVFCRNYESVRSSKFKWGDWVHRGVKAKTAKTSYQWKVPQGTLFIFDEVHKCKDRKTQNSKLLVGAIGDYKLFLMSATVAENPMHLYAMGMALGLHSGDSEFFWFLRSHGVSKVGFGLKFTTNPENRQRSLNKIRAHIYPERGYRINPRDIPGFPENSIQLVAVDSPDSAPVQKELDRLYEKMLEEVGASLSITDMLRARQESELCKLAYIAEKTEQLIEEGNSVVVFLNFIDSINALKGMLEDSVSGISVLRGGCDAKREVDLFQSNINTLMIAQGDTGGVGVSLHDLQGRPRVSLISPSYSAVNLIQVLGRINRSGSLSKSIQQIICLANTIEMRIYESLNRKIDNISMINDNDTNPLSHLANVKRKSKMTNPNLN
jgi:hypothetical protein